MPFGLKNARATYMRAMTTIFHDIIHREIEVYVDDVIIKSKKQSDHVKDLRKFFQRLRMYNLKLNPTKCAFGVPSGKLLGFVVSRRGIELDPSKIKAIQELPPPKNKTELLKKNVVVKWTDKCQEAFDKIKRYLSNPPVLVPPEPGRPLILYLIVLDNSFGCVLGQHDITGKKEQTIYYLKVMCVDEVDRDEKPGWKLFFDGPANMKGVGVGAVLISETGQHYPVTAQLRFHCTNNMAEYEACILGLRSVKFRHIPRIHNEIADALATLASMLHHSDKAYVDPMHSQVRNQHAYCNVVEEEIDGEPWFHDVKEYIRSGVYPVHATGDQKRTILRMASGFFLSGGILYKRTPDLGLLRYIDAKKASTTMVEVHSGVCGPHMNGYVLAKKILRAGTTPYLLVYGTEAVIPAEVEIPSFRIVAEAEIDDDEWVKTRLEQLSLIDEKRLAAVCHGQLYQKRMARAYNKKVCPWKFKVGQMVLKRILPHQAEAKGKFAPN
ncbi:uncharacterized protein [Nicotiana sylvestris]|uniref:uncharacterized protein n=1 Tax=Nicotiana sylvestris TaxID=4096 RepID=UPI00388CD5A8